MALSMTILAWEQFENVGGLMSFVIANGIRIPRTIPFLEIQKVLVDLKEMEINRIKSKVLTDLSINLIEGFLDNKTMTQTIADYRSEINRGTSDILSGTSVYLKQDEKYTYLVGIPPYYALETLQAEDYSYLENYF